MKLRCGVAGLGRGKLFVETFSRMEGCEVVAVCDPNPATFQGLTGPATYTSYEQFLDEELDIVAVISPGPVHAEQSLQALERGANVLCETPCVYSLDEARRVVAAVEKTGLKYMLAENYIWMDWFAALRRAELGDILFAEGDYTHDCRDFMLLDEGRHIPYAEWRQHPHAKKTWRATHLPPIQYCSHTLGPILRLMGDRIVSAYGLSLGGKVAPDLVPTELEAALFQTQKGAIIRLTNGFAVPHPLAFYFNFVGTHGSAKILSAGDTYAKCWTELGGTPGRWEDFPAAFFRAPDGRGDLDAMLREFVDSVLHDNGPPINVHESMDMILPGILAHQSGLHGGVKLDVPDSRTWA